jgi:RNA polymerase sigma factor (TIGR02999 family)
MPGNDVSRILDAAAQGDARAARELLPLVYDELRKLAAQRLAQEKPGQMLQATALVHEAYLRVAGSQQAEGWNGRGHFFAAAAEAMRRILIEEARAKGREKRGGGWGRVSLDSDVSIATTMPDEQLLALDGALTRLEGVDGLAARVVKLRYFAGLSMPEVAEALGIALRTAERNWTYARTWLRREIAGSAE